jgi:hypothetical protein
MTIFMNLKNVCGMHKRIFLHGVFLLSYRIPISDCPLTIAQCRKILLGQDMSLFKSW